MKTKAISGALCLVVLLASQGRAQEPAPVIRLADFGPAVALDAKPGIRLVKLGPAVALEANNTQEPDQAQQPNKTQKQDRTKNPESDEQPGLKPRPEIKAPQPPPRFDPSAAQTLSSQTGESMTGFAPQMLGDGGYLDSAVPMTTFRLRYDVANGVNRPDRAEYIYGAWQQLSIQPLGVVSNGVVKNYFFDPNARGPVQPVGSVSYQEDSAYLEYAFNRGLSVFVDLPYRFVNVTGPFVDAQEIPNPPTNANGISDLQFGFKFALIADPDRFLTFQLRSYVPTGNASLGLGTGHYSLEPGLLYFKQVTERLFVQAQLTDWIPIDGTAEAGNVLSYGFGFSYIIFRSPSYRIAPVAEFLGWTVLSGYESFFLPNSTFNTNGFDVPNNHGVTSAVGDTIINGKIGVRTYLNNGVDCYIGYGQALTSDRWYSDIIRVELRFCF